MARKVGNPNIVDTQRQGMTDVPNGGSWKSEANNGRQPMGNAATGWSNRSTAVAPARLETKQGFGKPDPLGITSGSPARRGTRIGAQYRISAKLPGATLEAQAVQANGRVLPPTHSQSGNFYAKQLDQGSGGGAPFPKGSWRGSY